MKKYIGCDAHARYSIFVSIDENGKVSAPQRVEHEGLEMEGFLKTLPSGSAVAWESSGNWYWLVQAIEQAGLEPRLAHALEANKRMPGRHKTDHLDAKGLALMLRNGSLPEWMLLDQLEEHMQALERRIRERIASLGWVRLLKTLPGVGTILGRRFTWRSAR